MNALYSCILKQINWLNFHINSLLMYSRGYSSLGLTIKLPTKLKETLALFKGHCIGVDPGTFDRVGPESKDDHMFKVHMTDFFLLSFFYFFFFFFFFFFCYIDST